jgi:general secretion pathway protein F
MYFEITYLKNGKKEKTIIEANNFIDAAQKFKSKKIGVFINAKETTEPLSIKIEKLKQKLKKKFSSSKIDLEEYVAVLEQIYVMLDASLSLNDILDSVSENIKNKKLKEIFTTLNQDLQSGINLSTSLKKYEKEIGKLSISMIELGEQTGMLAESFRDLAEILNEILENRKKLKSATRYPMFILFAMLIAFTIVILFVIPPFKGIFEDLGAQLPMPTRFLLWLEHFLRTFGPWILGFGVVMMGVVNYLYDKYEKVEFIIDKWMLKVYIVGSVIHYALLGRFLYSFDKMVEAGIPIMDALDTALGVVDNLYLRTQLLKIKNSIAEGRGLATGFEESKLFDKLIVQMIQSGENSGALNRMLSKSSNYYRSKYLYIVENISTLIEPILIAAIAGFVIMLAFGIFLPMWGMADAVKGSG